MVQVRNGLQNIRLIHWDKADVGASDKAIRILFYDGIEECYGLAGVDIQYQEDAIIVTLSGGTVPGANICIDIAVMKSTIIQLEEAVNGRKILDGATR